MQTQEIESVVIRFSGDSGDGMQLTGTQFSNTSAVMGNDVATFPDYPSEIRAPSGTIAGVSGFQVHIGASEILSPGDDVDMLVAMNPAALKANLHSLKRGGAIIVNIDAFTNKNLEKAGYVSNPLDDNSLDEYQLVKAPISSQTQEALAQIELDTKAKDRCKNFYALGMSYFFYGRSLENTIKWIQGQFASKPLVIEANIAALKAGYNLAETTEKIISVYKVPKARLEKGIYRQISGNQGTAWGFVQASEAAGLPLFLGSYPITPATDILHELSKLKNFGVTTVQAEDEIAGICTAIGASLAGQLSITTTSGPGMALKTEAIGLAITYEIPLVIVNVQRGGPSTGLPTKTEQSDLFQAMFGRNGEAPLVVLSASRPSDCFHMAYEASRLALKHMTPVVLLTDGYIANGSEPWRIPELSDSYAHIDHRKINPTDLNGNYAGAFARDEEWLTKNWIIPGMKGLEFRLGGLEKDIQSGCVSYDPFNHEKMTLLRQEKVDRVAVDIPEQKLSGPEEGKVLVLSWGGTFGAVQTAVRKLQSEGHSISHAHLRYINPLPSNLGLIISKFEKVIIPELNLGQLKFIIDGKFGLQSINYNKVQGLPFKVSELYEFFGKHL